MTRTRERKRAGPGNGRAVRALGALLSGGLLLLGLLIGGWGPGGPAGADEEAPAAAAPGGAEERTRPAAEGVEAGGDLPVDCLLPADISRLGGQLPHIGPRRLVQVPAAECRSRGGEEVAPGAGPADPDASE